MKLNIIIGLLVVQVTLLGWSNYQRYYSEQEKAYDRLYAPYNPDYNIGK